MIGNSNDETNFWHKLLLTNTQVLILPEAFATTSSTNVKLPKTQLSKIIVRNVSRYTSWTITKDWFAFNKKYSYIQIS